MDTKIILTRSGKKADWISGGGYTNTGFATIICGDKGQPLVPYYVRTRGHLACGDHALVPVKVGYFYIDVDNHRADNDVKVYRVDDFYADDDGNVWAKRSLYWSGVWNSDIGDWQDIPAWGDTPIVNDITPPDFLKNAIDSAIAKANCYHCRCPHYIADRD